MDMENISNLISKFIGIFLLNKAGLTGWDEVKSNATEIQKQKPVK